MDDKESPKAERSRARRLLGAAIIAGLLAGVLPLAPPSALAATGATASVDRTLSYRGQSHTYTFTVNNTSTAAEGLGSVAIVRPSTSWTVTSCPAPPPGYTATRTAQYCVWNSSVGSGDDIPAGGSMTFTIRASVAAGDATETGGNWAVYADATDIFNQIDGYVTASETSVGALAASIYAIRITQVSVGTAAPTLGASCPASSKKAPAGSTRVLSVCGYVHGTSAFTAQPKKSSVTGTFVQADGDATTASIPAGAGPVVLANFSLTTVTPTVSSELHLTASLTNNNASVSSPSTRFDGYTTDTTAPAVPSTPDLDPASDTGRSSSDDITRDSTPTFIGTAEPNSQVDIFVGPNLKATATTSGAGSYSATIADAATLTDGARSVTARATDTSGNVSGASAALNVTLDTAQPAGPVLGAGPGSTGSGATPSWSFIGEAEAIFTCSLTRPDTTVVNDTACLSPKTFNISTGGDGTYTFDVTQEDVAGNRSVSSTSTYVLDREGPAAPTISSRPPDATTDPAVAWTFTGEPGGTFECILVRPDLSEVKHNGCASPKSYDLSTGADGTYTFKVRQVDDAGHSGAYASDSFVLDREPPAMPTIDSSPSARSKNTDPTWSFSGEAGGSFVCVLIDPQAVRLSSLDCSSPKTYDIAGGPEGTYTFRVRQIDDLGSTGSFATSSFVLDRDAPAAPSITARPANHDDETSPSWTFEGEAGGTFECVLVLPDATEMSSSSCSSPKSFDIATEDDGTYTFKVRQIDDAGNAGEYQVDDYTLDRVPPGAPSLDTRPADVVSNPAVQWSFSGEAGASFQCVLVKPDLSEIEDTSCGSPKVFDLGAYADGTYTFKVRQVDRAGHPGAYAIDSFYLDREPPAAPTITSQPDATTKNDSPEWRFSGEANTTFECVLVKPGNVQVTTSNCATPRTYDLTGEADGSYTFKVRQFDSVGNPSVFASSSFVLDRNPPAAPSITSQPRNYDDDVAPRWDFTGETGSSFQCVLVRPDTTEVSDMSCSNPKTYELTSEADGTYTFKVQQIDAAGNPGPYATDDYTFDRTPPRPVLMGGAPDLTNDPTHEWTFTGIPNPVFECTLIHPDETTTVDAGCTPPYAVDLTDAPDGTYTLSVRQFLDENGSVPATDTFTLDRQALAPSVSVQPGPVGNDPAPIWAFSGEAGATFECVLVGPDGSAQTDAGCTAPQQPTLGGGDGTYRLKVRQTDAAGNTSAFGSRTYKLDTQAPPAPTFGSTPKRWTRDLTPAWSFTGEAGAAFDCALRRPDGVTTTQPNCSSPTAYVLDRAQGGYTFSVTQTDAAGNQSPASTHSMRVDLKKPVVKRLRVGPKSFRPTRRTVVKIAFGRSEPAVANVIIKKGRKAVKVFKVKRAKSKVALRWKTMYRKKVIKPGKYTVIVKLKDRVGLRATAKKTFTARR